MKTIWLTIIFLISLVSYAEALQWMASQPIIDNYVFRCAQQTGGHSLDGIKKHSRLLSEHVTEYTDAYDPNETGVKRYSLFFDGVVVKGFNVPNKKFFCSMLK